MEGRRRKEKKAQIREDDEEEEERSEDADKHFKSLDVRKSRWAKGLEQEVREGTISVALNKIYSFQKEQ